MKNSFQGETYAKVKSGFLYTGLFSFILLSFLLLLFPADVFSGQVTLTWNKPTTNVDGTPISYFIGDYRIYYGTASGSYSQVRNLNNSNSLVTQQVPNLTDGQPYFFVVTAVNTLGNESAYSSQVSKTAQSGTPTTYTVTASAGANGTITPAGTTLVNTGASQAYSITPGSAAYHVASVLVDGSPVGTVTSYTFSNVTANHTISATFATITTPPPPPPPGNVMLIPPATSGLMWDNTYKGLGVGVSLPLYTVDVSAMGAMESQLHFSLDGSNGGGWVTSVLDNNLFLSSGAYYNNAAGGWIQASPDGKSAFIGTQSVGYQLFLQSGCVEGNVCTPSEKLRVDYNGNMGIGTKTPSQKLEINGGVKMNTADARPACNATTRGTFWFTQDDVNGDSTDVCARVGASYAWRKLF